MNIRTGAGLDLLQAYQHGEFCLCTDPNEAPDRTETCIAIRRDLEDRIEAIERESGGRRPTPPTWDADWDAMTEYDEEGS